jgi:hypothetical protein
MAKSRRTTSTVFDTITLEGGLIPSAMLTQIAERKADHQAETDYSVPKGLTLRDETARYFRIAAALYRDFAASPAPSAEATISFAQDLLSQVFGFSDLERRGSREGVHLLAKKGRVPVVVVPPADDLDHASAWLTGEGRRRSAASALQDWLNHHEDVLWGLSTNGELLRLMRDNASLTRPAYVEVNLHEIFEGENFADFAAAWLLLHSTRFGEPGSQVTDCCLERWREAGAKEGLVARDRLRDGVEAALLALGNGFLAHPDNAGLRDRLANGELALPVFFGQLLRLVYRLIFLFVAEDRGLLHAPGADAASAKLYAEGYSVAALRERALRRTAWDRHYDRWEGLLITFRSLADGQPKLGLPALGGLFENIVPDLEAARLSNKALMEAIYRLAWLKDGANLVPVNWRDMETEELGSVYESLLELTPMLVDHGRGFDFAKGDETKGNQRKTTGSYYTPDSLVQTLLDSALDPVLDRVESEAANRVEGLLGVTVVDPACGSGHFLLGAARRIATRVARARTGGVASAADYRHALRDAVRSCIHGVDRNPMAVELTKVALWIETVEPGKPLGFLDASILCGDSLLGVFDLEVLRAGIPDAAYKPLSGDDKAAAKYFDRRNRAERDGQGTLDFAGGKSSIPTAPPLAASLRAVRTLPEDSTAQISEKRRRLQAVRAEVARENWRIGADLYMAAFLLPKKEIPREDGAAMVPTTNHLWHKLAGGQVYGSLLGATQEMREQARLFHWPLEFPDIFAKGGFDVVIGNPPWERIKIQEQEYFAAREPEIAQAPTAHARGKMIERLKQAEVGTRERRLHQEFETAKRIAEASALYAREGGRFPLTGRGDVNTFALFAEVFAALPERGGRAGIIAPTQLVTADSAKLYFSTLMGHGRVVSFIGFLEIRQWFPATDDRSSFGILTIGSGAVRTTFAFALSSTQDLLDRERRFVLGAREIALINPNTRTAPLFRSKADADLTAGIYSRIPALIRDEDGAENPWGITFLRMFDMANDSGLFRTAPEHGCVPLLEAKMIHQFDHRWSTYDGAETRDLTPAEKSDPTFEPKPRYWLPESAVRDRLAEKDWTRKWLMGWRDICRATDQRTLIASVIPAYACGHKFPLLFLTPEPSLSIVLLGCLNSLVCDYLARQKLSGTSLTYSVIKQLAVPPPSAYSTSEVAVLARHVLELSFTSCSLAHFAHDLGYDGPPFPWDVDRRAFLRAELETRYARAYGLTRDELRYILDPADVMGEGYPSETFRVLKNNEMRKYGEYRTRRLVLEAWDRLAQEEASRAEFAAVPASVSTTQFANGAWIMPNFNSDAVTAQLAALLKKLPGPTAAETVRLAAIYALYPHFLTPLLKGKAQGEWQRLTGSRLHVNTNVVSFAPKISVEWRDAYTQLKATRALIEDPSTHTWAAGPATHTYYTASWPDGRAGFVMKALEEIGIDTAITKLPADVQVWVKEYAA